MARYLIRRVLWAAVLFVAITLVTFVLFFIVPADPARTFVGGENARPELVARARHELGLDKPVYVQYALFMNRLVVHQSLGRSFKNRQSVNGVVAHAAPVTATLVFGGAVTWLLLALPIGVFSALHPRSVGDRAAMIFVLIGISAHPVWLGLLASYIVGYKLHVTPLGGYCDFFGPYSTNCGGPVEWAYHMVLPWFTFALLFAALYVRMIRANVLEAMNEDYVRTARAKGAPESVVMRSHILRNAMLPVVTMLGMDIGLALGGAIFTESVYGLPGLGKAAVQSLEAFDMPVVMGIVIFATFAIIVFNLIVDLVYAWVDPRIRLS